MHAPRAADVARVCESVLSLDPCSGIVLEFNTPCLKGSHRIHPLMAAVVAMMSSMIVMIPRPAISSGMKSLVDLIAMNARLLMVEM